MKIYLKTLAIGFAVFIMHLLIVFFIPSLQSINLVLAIYLFFFIWMGLYMPVLYKVHMVNKNWTISMFMLLTVLKMVLSAFFILIVNSYFNTETKLLIIQFFIPFFVFLILQVNYSVKIIR